MEDFEEGRNRVVAARGPAKTSGRRVDLSERGASWIR
jgi:hypothetical protein